MNDLTADELRDVFKDLASFKQWYKSLSVKQRQTLENLVAELSENPRFEETLGVSELADEEDLS